MRGDLPFDPFMIKQRMPFFLYSLEELRCDLTAFRECVALGRDEDADPHTRDRAVHVQHAILFDRLFRFPLTGSRVRNYDGLGGQLLFAWLHQHHVLHQGVGAASGLHADGAAGGQGERDGGQKQVMHAHGCRLANARHAFTRAHR
jgi:hypothetical protein